MTCIFDGNPEPTVNWVLDTGTINGDITTNTTTSILTLTNVQPSDSGTYQCVVNNSIDLISESIAVSVQG